MLSSKYLDLFAKKLTDINKPQQNCHKPPNNQLQSQIQNQILQSQQKNITSLQHQKDISNIDDRIPHQCYKNSQSLNIIQIQSQPNSQIENTNRKQSSGQLQIIENITSRQIPIKVDLDVINIEDSSNNTIIDRDQEEKNNRLFMLGRDLTDKQRIALQSMRVNALSNPFFEAVENYKRKAQRKSIYSSQFMINLPNIQVRTSKFTVEGMKYLPPVCVINNLLELSNVIGSQQLKIQMKRYSIKFRIPFNRILISFGIEKLMQMFHKQHDIDFDPAQKYVYQKMSKYIVPFFRVLQLKNWFVFRRIVKGFLRRFGASRVFHDIWLENHLKKKKDTLEQIGVNVFGLMAGKHTLLKTSNYINYDKFIKEEQPKNARKKFVNYREIYPDLDLQEETKRDKMHNPQQARVVSKLKYFQKRLAIKQKDREVLREEAAQILTGKQDDTILNFTRDPMPLVFDIAIPRAPLPVDLSQIISSHKQISYDRLGNIRVKKLGKHMDLCDESSSEEPTNKMQQKIEVEFIKKVKNEDKTKRQRILQKRKLKKYNNEVSQVAKQTINRMQQYINGQEILIPEIQQKLSQQLQSIGLCEEIIDSDLKQKDESSPQIIGIQRPKPRRNRNPATIDKNPQLSKLSVEEIIAEMDRQIQAYVESHPEYKIEQLMQQIKRILIQRNVPVQKHKDICSFWASFTG